MSAANLSVLIVDCGLIRCTDIPQQMSSDGDKVDVKSRARRRGRQRADQRPGEEAVQVNDAYDGGGPAPEEPTDDMQHATGG